MRYSYLVLLLCLPSCRPAPPASRTEALDRLLVLIEKRLEIMHDVARWKWAEKSSIEDHSREAHLLDDLASRGEPLGLDPDLCRAFFRAQIEAAKRVQRADFERWESADRREQEPGPAAPDLVEVLRPRIDALNSEMLAALAEVARGPRDDHAIRGRADSILSGIDAETRAVAIRPLLVARALTAP
jgi:chorismate mutase-like protein